ncbi:hypothetical protein EV639_10691 [Rathayibacter tanaceti]|uniref:Uncharacterized protein n=2 Tax=Rathayibacter tanaceti TaxID=1671680 RepID=A0ACD2XIX4_9MICO|nr:hypothetical protein ACH61_01220 [Rathayibacter tanaceti]TCO36688.1 hypothetical protein EV639_10691 [Rathayibacter tanaceti]
MSAAPPGDEPPGAGSRSCARGLVPSRGNQALTNLETVTATVTVVVPSC